MTSKNIFKTSLPYPSLCPYLSFHRHPNSTAVSWSAVVLIQTRGTFSDIWNQAVDKQMVKIYIHTDIKLSRNRNEMCLPLDTYLTTEQQMSASSDEVALGWNQMTGNPGKYKIKPFHQPTSDQLIS